MDFVPLFESLKEDTNMDVIGRKTNQTSILVLVEMIKELSLEEV